MQSIFNCCFWRKRSKSLTELPQRGGGRGPFSRYTDFFAPSPFPTDSLSYSGNSRSFHLSLRVLSRRLGTFCEFFVFSSLSSVHYGEQRDFRRKLRREKALVFVTGAADITISILPRAFQARRRIVKQRLHWIKLVKRGMYCLR